MNLARPRPQPKSEVLEAGRIVEYLQSSQDDKEAIARSIASEQRITQSPVCALSCVEPCWGFDIHRNGETKELELVQRSRKCLYVYPSRSHRSDESPAGYSLASCSPAELASASPA